ncbi:MAG: C45 family autoproteolytic acyltransferase/hydrolase [Planctomycetota bacterium]|nr:C45 family autoproteolytic acyltransferase/hydrolase [Planctomycetota bacterium]
MRILAAIGCLWLSSLPAVVAQAETATPIRSVDFGRLERFGDLRILHTWGTPEQRGRAHGLLLGQEIADLLVAEFGVRFRRQPETRAFIRTSLPRMIEYPEPVQAELQAIFAAMQEGGVDLRCEQLDCDLDLLDLQVANALDVFGLMACSGFTVAGEQVVGGGVLTARNFDWPCKGAHLVDDALLHVQHFDGGHATASITWPGYVAIITGINSDGVAGFLHVGNAEIDMTPEPSSWPTAIALREILEDSDGEPVDKVFGLALDRLGYTSPPAGYLTRIVLPSMPAAGPPAGLFESSTEEVLRADLEGPVVVTNHFQGRKDVRGVSDDSMQRFRDVRGQIDECLVEGDKQVSVDEAWQMLESVQKGNHRFGTLHSLVFRHDPWCFQLRIGKRGEKDVIPAPISERRYDLPRRLLFPTVPTGPGQAPAGRR